MKSNENEKGGEPGRVGIISLYGWLKIWDNYGTLLQNFALQKFLQKKGYSTFWIRTRPSVTARNRLITIGLSAWDVIRAGLRFLLIPFLGVSQSQRIAKFNAQHPRKFSEFMSRYTPTTRQEFTVEELEKESLDVSALIVGSDQVWRDVSKINFLGFGPQNVLRIAYAVSAPWPSIDNEWIKRASQFIPKFDAISVREVEGVEICKKLERGDAFHALDPVLLLDAQDYLDVVRQDEEDINFSSPVVLGYFVNLNSIDQIPWEASIEFANARESELKAIPMQGAELVLPKEFMYVPSPCGWMNAIHKSSCVITSSYHGALFAIVMRKPFLVFLQGGVSSHQNGRFTSALNPLGLADRIMTVDAWREATPEFLETQMSRAIDWDSVCMKLDEWRARSAKFLIDSLEKTSQ